MSRTDVFASLETEAVRPEFALLDALAVPDLVALMAAESARSPEAVIAATAQIADAVAGIARQLAGGGRLIYVGAGTAGRLGVLDAAEVGPTFDVPDGVVIALIAGGGGALVRPQEGAEDDGSAARAELSALGCSPQDVVVGISASGQTKFVAEAIAYARAVGALTIGIVSSRDSAIASAAHIAIELVVGGEVIAGSTRLNAGTAQKITLNILSTAVMIQLGKTYGNLMVDVRPTNDKLRDRATRIVSAVAGTSAEQAAAALEACGWRTKVACIVAASALRSDEAAELLDASGGGLRAALEAANAGRRANEGSTGRRPANLRRLGVSAFLQHGRLVPGDVAVDGGTVAAIGLPAGKRGIAVPGFVDLQVNGYLGVDALVASVDELASLGESLARDGVLAYQPTLISSEIASTRAATRRIAELSRREPDGARVLGVHLEGPFLSPLRAGAHPVERLVPPDLDLLESLLSAGVVTMVTLAPELPDALPLVALCRQRNVVVSFGHSDADADQARSGFDAGGRAVTHIFNAMAPISARSPGLAGAALADPRVSVQLIADGVHVADDLLRVVIGSAPHRWSLVSDATAASGRGDGNIALGEVPAIAQHGVVRRQDGTIAGSAARLIDGVRHVAQLGVPLGEVLAGASERPAALLGQDGVGRIRLGGRADLVVLTDDLQVDQVLLGGRSLL